MNGRDFFDAIAKHPRFEWLGVKEGKCPDEDEVIIRDRKADYTYGVAVRSILDSSFEDLEAVLTGLRNPVIMIHMTRVVGYYSQVRNWNGSMRAQLRDRQKGNYALSG